jgi:hypothetical protein
MLPIEFFDIQIKFAKKVSDLSGLPIQDSLLRYTFLFRNFFVPSSKLIKTNKVWEDFLSEIKTVSYENITKIAYEFSKKRMLERKMFDRSLYTGKPCFLYELKDTEVYLHFNNNEGSMPGPLSKERIFERTKELQDIFKEIKDIHPEVKTVNCYSWLVNLPSFMRLFPVEFGRNKNIVKNDFKSLDIWGQFLDSGYQMKTEMVDRFLSKLNTATDISESKGIFDFYPVKINAPIELLLNYYKID